MDIIAELKRISSEKDNTKNILKSMNDEFEKKLHLFRVFEFAYAIDTLIADKHCEKHLCVLKIFNNKYESRPLMLIVSDSKGNEILKGFPQVPETIMELKPLVEHIATCKIEYTCCGNISVGTPLKIELKKGAGSEILKHLLSDELRAMLDYSQMQIELDDKKEIAPKKIKV